MQVLLETIQLEKVGKFEGPDVASAVADFLLEVSDDAGQILPAKSGANKLIPEPLPVKTQGKVLTGQSTIGLMELFEGRLQRGGDS
jgi:hypothetical protein